MLSDTLTVALSMLGLVGLAGGMLMLARRQATRRARAICTLLPAGVLMLLGASSLTFATSHAVGIHLHELGMFAIPVVNLACAFLLIELSHGDSIEPRGI